MTTRVPGGDDSVCDRVDFIHQFNFDDVFTAHFLHGQHDLFETKQLPADTAKGMSPREGGGDADRHFLITGMVPSSLLPSSGASLGGTQLHASCIEGAGAAAPTCSAAFAVDSGLCAVESCREIELLQEYRGK